MMSSGARFSRQPQSVQIYQDNDSYDHAPMPQMHNANGVKVPSPLRSIKYASSRRNATFNPPNSAPNRPSPLKSSQHDPSIPSLSQFNKLNSISMPPPPTTHYQTQTDSMEKQHHDQARYGSQPPVLFSNFDSSQMGKENYHSHMYPPQQGYTEATSRGNYANDGLYSYQTPQKRILMDSAPIQESGRPSKRSKIEPEPVLPSPAQEQFPALHDDGSKPGHSYAQLIGMAILRAPNRRLTLAQIYKWISDTYSFYGATDAGWQNSIRHNLSLNKAFVKQERPKDDPGKGNYWTIEQGMDAQFLKDKSSRKSAASSDQINPVSSTPAPTPSQDATNSSAYKPLKPAPAADSTASPTLFSPVEAKATSDPEPSSDATIPASDSPDDKVEGESRSIQSSPPPAVMQSSPPIARQILSRSGDDTPPSLARFSTTSNDRGHKRVFTSADDSGYFSSLNSSVLRGNPEIRSFEADWPQRTTRHGRAEEAIARLRGSSYDSPTKTRSFGAVAGNNYAPSSPLRRDNGSLMLPPLTPAVKLKAPLPAPPSVSPNTNLKLHRDRVRQLVGSPDRGSPSIDDHLLWTPQFRLTEDAYPVINFEDGFDIFADTDFGSFSTGSPAKRSHKRPGLERAHTANVLSEISLSAQDSQNNTPISKLHSVPKLAPSAFDPPAKALDSSTPVKPLDNVEASDTEPQQQDFLGAEFLNDEPAEFDGVDIMQGFQKIGAGGQRSKIGGAPSRPAFGRSYTTTF